MGQRFRSSLEVRLWGGVYHSWATVQHENMGRRSSIRVGLASYFGLMREAFSTDESTYTQYSVGFLLVVARHILSRVRHSSFRYNTSSTLCKRRAASEKLHGTRTRGNGTVVSCSRRNWLGWVLVVCFLYESNHRLVYKMRSWVCWLVLSWFLNQDGGLFVGGVSIHSCHCCAAGVLCPLPEIPGTFYRAPPSGLKPFTTARPFFGTKIVFRFRQAYGLSSLCLPKQPRCSARSPISSWATYSLGLSNEKLVLRSCRHFTRVHSNQDLTWCVKIGLYVGLWHHLGF